MKKFNTFVLFAVAIAGQQHYAFAANEFQDNCIAEDCVQTHQTVNETSLEKSIVAAIMQSPELAEIKSVLNVDNARVDEQKGAWMPQVFVNGASRDLASNNNSDNESYGISISQLLYDFGRTTNSISQAKSTVEGDNYKIQSSLNDIADKVSTLYVRAKRYQTLIDIAKDNIVSLKKVENLAQLRSEAGLSTASDVLQAQTRLIAMQTSLEDFRYQYSLALKQLAVLTGIQASALSSLPRGASEPLLPFNRHDYETLPTVRAAMTEKQSADYEVSKAKAGYMPTLSLRAERAYSQNNGTSSDPSWDNHLTVNVSVPLYQGGIVSSRVEQAQGNVASAQARIQKAKMDAEQRIDSFMEDWKGAQARKANSDRQLQSARKTREVYRNEYTLNNRSLNDLLSVEQDVFQAQQAQTMAEYDSLQASLSYAASTNALLKKLNIMP
ncbi:TolC family outer membrane protein [Citrobacter sp. ku-bf4]|uniref:TolC family outer membrane protein n=1 Tax=Citrobacter TaxID=544 RepID=UPI00197DAE09|nr:MULTISPECIES: TolC family outer membrane protein [Citrobacter]MBN6046218.1 TolC family outer membrane protein [Citrobacter sp. ku-bf4]MBS0827734.1 TolC family outer membrane protein [Citrobacter amalonaticus]